jgi:hypothetical protein
MPETSRIRWERELNPGSFRACPGYAGAIDLPVFDIYKPAPGGADYVLTTALAGMASKRAHGTPDELKAEAEKWLAGFAASLGAVFPDGADWGVRFAHQQDGDVQRYRDEADARQAKAEVEALVGARRGTVMTRGTWTGPWVPAGEENDSA